MDEETVSSLVSSNSYEVINLKREVKDIKKELYNLKYQIMRKANCKNIQDYMELKGSDFIIDSNISSFELTVINMFLKQYFNLEYPIKIYDELLLLDYKMTWAGTKHVLVPRITLGELVADIEEEQNRHKKEEQEKLNTRIGIAEHKGIYRIKDEHNND